MPCNPFKQNHKRIVVESLLDIYDGMNDSHLFMSVGNVVPWTDRDGNVIDSTPPSAVDSVKEDTSFWRRIYAHKRIDREDVSFVVRRFDWETGRVYTPYRDDVDLFDDDSPSPFYVLVDQERVYKCIDNNNDSPSLVVPTHTDSEIRKLSDGYRWKFLYQIPESKRKFMTKNESGGIGFMPVEYVEVLKQNDEKYLQWNIQQNAVDGEIAFIRLNRDVKPFVLSSRCLYPNDENLVTIGVSAGATGVYVSSPNMIPRGGYYDDMVLSIDSRGGQGQRRRIRSFTPTGGPEQAFITVDNPFSLDLDGGGDGSRFSIVPNIKVVGDGTSRNNQYDPTFKAADVLVRFGSTADVDPDLGECNIIREVIRSVDSFELVDGGKDYTFATIQIATGLTLSGTRNTGVGVNLQDLAIPVMSPPGGHGSNAVKELGCSTLMIVKDFDRTEDGDMSIDNEFRQIGILQNPKLVEPQVRLKFYQSGFDSSFLKGQTAGMSGSSVYGDIISWYPGLSGFTGTSELVVTNVQNGNFAIGSYIDNFKILTVDKREIAGTEIRNLLKMTVIPTKAESFNQFATDFRSGMLVFGIGDEQTNISQSRASADIYKWRPALGSNLFGYIFAENPRGEFILGEKINQMDPYLFQFTYGSTGHAKITQIDKVIENGNGVYDQTTTIVVTYNGSNPFNEKSFIEDEYLSFEYGLTDSANGYVMDWKTFGGLTGALRLTGTQGRFYEGMTVNYHGEGDTLYSAGLTSILHTGELKYRSGDILYIQNVKPVQRSIDQREEMKIIIDF